MSKLLEHDFTDFVAFNGYQICKYCRITGNNDKLPTFCYSKSEALA